MEAAGSETQRGAPRPLATRSRVASSRRAHDGRQRLAALGDVVVSVRRQRRRRGAPAAPRISLAARGLRRDDRAPAHATRSTSTIWRTTALSWPIPRSPEENARQKILYEEYHPYGTSAYRSSNGSVDVSARRYRYTGKERDDETGLYYNGARYLAAWLGRWTSADPIGIGADGPGLYNYTRGSPVNYTDPSGTDGVRATDEERTIANFLLDSAISHNPSLGYAFAAIDTVVGGGTTSGLAAGAVKQFGDRGSDFAGFAKKVGNIVNPFRYFTEEHTEENAAAYQQDVADVGIGILTSPVAIASSLYSNASGLVQDLTAPTFDPEAVRYHATGTGLGALDAVTFVAGVKAVLGKVGLAETLGLGKPSAPAGGANALSQEASSAKAPGPLAGITDAEISAAVDGPASSGPMFQIPSPFNSRFNVDPAMMTNEFSFPAKTSVPGASGDVSTRIRIHTADPAAPPGSNSASGPTATIMQAKGARRFIPDEGWFSVREGTPDQMNRAHIPLFW